MKNENYAKSNDLKVLQNDIKNIKNRVDFDKIAKIRLDDLTQLSYEDYQNIKKLKDNNKRSKSVSGFKNQNENYTFNFTNGEMKPKENIEIERENEIKKIKND